MDWPYAKTAVVTGAASGIGRAIAEEGLKQGFKVGIVDFDADAAETTVNELEQTGGECEAFQCDVRNLEEVQAAADHFFDAWGEVGLLVNNAGIGGGGYVGDIPIEEWERVVNTDLWGVVYGCHTFIPRMKEQGGGYILNTASGAGIVSLPEMAPYNVAKAGVISLSETLKSELAPWNIGVTVLCPSFVNTNILDRTTVADEEQRELGEAAIKNARMSCEEVARRTMRAVEKNKLYALPQATVKFNWAYKRMSPALFHGTWAYLNRKGLYKPLALRLAKKGMV